VARRPQPRNDAPRQSEAAAIEAAKQRLGIKVRGGVAPFCHLRLARVACQCGSSEAWGLGAYVGSSSPAD
jgi:hypothetical protein